jgi:hypothetical protein
LSIQTVPAVFLLLALYSTIATYLDLAKDTPFKMKRLGFEGNIDLMSTGCATWKYMLMSDLPVDELEFWDPTSEELSGS